MWPSGVWLISACYCHVSVSSLWLIHRTGSSSAWLAVSSYSEDSRKCWFCWTFRCLLWFSGHDTTTSGVCWTLYLLAKHPECQQRCQREIDALLEGRQNGDLLWWGVPPPTTPPPPRFQWKQANVSQYEKPSPISATVENKFFKVFLHIFIKYTLTNLFYLQSL